MLGRLFARQGEHSSIGSSVPIQGYTLTNNGVMATTLGSSVAAGSNQATTSDDAFSRTVLYGSSHHLEMQALDLEKIRLLIIKSNGGYYERDNYRTLFDSNNVELSSDTHDVSELIPKVFGNLIYQDFDANDAYKVIKVDGNAVMASLHFKHRWNFAIVLVLPLGMTDFSNQILSNWSYIRSHLQLLKASFIKNHCSAKGTDSTTRSKLTSNFIDVVSIFKRFLKSLELLLNTPRLLIGLTNRVDDVLVNWCTEVNNWIEIKDGGKNHNSGCKFLVSLLTLINERKHKILNPTDELLRVVIMTANPVVSQKLVFIISGLLSYGLDINLSTEEETFKEKSLAIEMPKLPLSSSTIATSSTATRASAMPIEMKQPSIINNGWEIPNTPSKSVTTPSIISHSSSVSNLNSVSYLSSSLSNSYSHPSFSTSYISRSFQYLASLTSISPSQESNSSNSSHNKTPSPALEYDEYPWDGLASHSQNNHHYQHVRNSSFSSLHTPTSLPRRGSNLELSRRKAKIPTLPRIRRTTSFFYKQEPDSISTKAELLDLMNSSIAPITHISSYQSKNVSILNIEHDVKPSHSTNRIQSLPKLTGYTQAYLPEFQLQACQTAPDLESKIVNSMKMDLANGGYEKTKTLFVSLRAREVKEISMTRSPNSSVTNGDQTGHSHGHYQEYRSTSRRFYQGGHPFGIERSAFDKIDLLLKEICKIVTDEQNDDNDCFDLVRVKQLLSQI